MADVTVTTPGGTSEIVTGDQFSYVPPPTVTAVSPKEGSTAGGTTVTITGANFGGATAVKFGETAAASVTINSEGTIITAVSPAGTGTVHLTVTTPIGTSATSTADQFSYVAPPSTPPSNPTPAGTGATTTPHTPVPPVKITLPLISNLRERLVHGTTLVVTFRLAVKARVRLIAHRGRKTVAKTPIRTLAAGNHRLLIVLNARRWPTRIELQSRALAALPTISR
jgi:hypothetical protein